MTHHRFQFGIDASGHEGQQQGQGQQDHETPICSGERSNRADQQVDILRTRQPMIAILDQQRLYIV